MDDAIAVMVEEESDPIRRSLSWASLAEELGLCWIDEIILLLARPWPLTRAWIVVGPFGVKLCELSVLTDFVGASGC